MARRDQGRARRPAEGPGPREDSSESPVHGAQEQSAYNGHFASVCYHPLFVFNQDGDCLAAKLRPGNVHSADGWDEVLLPVIGRHRSTRPGRRLAVRPQFAYHRPATVEDPAAVALGKKRAKYGYEKTVQARWANVSPEARREPARRLGPGTAPARYTPTAA